MTRAGRASLVAAALLAGCAHHPRRGGPAPTGAHYTVGYPWQAQGEWHYPRAFGSYDRTGLAAVIPPGHDAATSDGEAFHQRGLMAQSPDLPLPSLVRVTNLVNGRSLIVRVDDRGPAMPGRILAVTRNAAERLGFPEGGVVEVRVRLLAGPSSALQMNLGAGPHLKTAPVASVQASALPPPPGASGSAGAASLGTPAAAPLAATPPAETVALSGVVRQGAPDPGPLYVEMGGFGSGTDAQALLARLYGMAGNVVPAPREGRTLYAVRLGPYHSVAAADAALRAVLARGVPDPEIVVH